MALPARDLTALLEDFHLGRTTPSDCLVACLAAAQSPLAAHAYCHLDDADDAAARAAAEAADQHWAQARQQGQPATALPRLLGVPLSLKDLYDVSGQVTLAGSRVLADAAPAAEDAPAVVRLRRAGAVFTGRTQMSEFAFSGVGINPHQGTPANVAWQRQGHQGRVPGGSSSGAAVSLASGAAWAALGSDTGGSIRIPAALQGLVGYKCSQSRVPIAGAYPLATSLDTVCALSLSVRDAVMLHEVLADRTVALAGRPLAARRCALVTRHFMDDLAPRIRAAFEAALDQLRAAGLQIDLVDLHELAELPELTAQGGITAAEAWQVHGARLADHEAAYDPRVVARVRRGAAIDEAMLARLRHHRADWQQRLAARLALYDAVLSPTVPIEPPEIAALQASDSAFFEANALLLRNPMVVNLADGCAISLPCQGPGALPVGLMLWSTQGRDDALLDLALAVEGALEAARG